MTRALQDLAFSEYLFCMLYHNYLCVTVSFLSSDLLESWGGECDGHTRGLARQGWTGGGGGHRIDQCLC